MYGHKLAHTGTGAIAVGGLSVAAEWLAALAAFLVVCGAALIRLGFRREQPLR
jgi:hypothetical protein